MASRFFVGRDWLAVNTEREPQYAGRFLADLRCDDSKRDAGNVGIGKSDIRHGLLP